ncbi:unnamed protein product [Urochloa decumbens]|uniref:NB-ARC domain-containing protein n=1 Tax=Urochloa decumbens TaxID=240449 RepID=A0ABC9D9J0_9POAL
MNILLSAFLCELTTRSINFIIRNSFKPTVQGQVIIDEATGRQITNQAVLQLLDKLRDAMHRGYYILDTFRYQPQNEDEAKGQVPSHPLSLSRINFLQGLCWSSKNIHILDQLQKSLDDLSFMILDVQEVVMFLMSYPRLYRQPYSMHLLLGNCMFGRQMETELVINFLLYTRPHGSKELEVLPIIGPAKVGKSTLIAHVCMDERVRDHFSKILFLHDHDFAGVELTTLREGYAIKGHQSNVSSSSKDGRLLLVVELVGDLNEDAWNRLYSASMRHVPSAYWYFFKTLSFGSIDPKMHPRFACMAMEIAKLLGGCFIAANMTACFLREKFDIQLWCKVLALCSVQTKKNISEFGGHPFDLINQKRPTDLGRMVAPFEDVMLYCEDKRSELEDVPKIKLQDVMFGSVKARGKFEILGWRSRIPPYHSYVHTCEIQELKTSSAKRKRCA